MTAYYNEFDPYAAQWLRNLIAAGLIPAGDVDERSIVDVQPGDLAGYTQCHFFAGIGGWALAARLAGWPDDRELWTGSPPCQPFSVAGKGKAQADDRHLWPHYFRLIRARRPAVAMGEQVAAAVGKAWLDGVFTDLEGIGYAGRASVVPACAVDGPHRRDRLWFVADRNGAAGHGVGARLEGLAGNDNDPSGRPQQDRPVTTASCGSDVADTGRGRCGEPGAREVQQPWGAEAVGRGEAGGAVAQPRGAGHDGAIEHATEPRRNWPDDRLSVGSSGELCGASTVADSMRAGSHASTQLGIHRGEEGAGAWDGGASGLCRSCDGTVADAGGERGQVDPNAGGCAQGGGAREVAGPGSAWDGAGWIIGHDGKARRVEPRIRLLAHGVPARVGRLRAYGNAIVPQVAAEVIGAYMDEFPLLPCK